MIETVKRAFSGDSTPPSATASGEGTKDWQPAAPVKRSVAADAITCLCCGDKFKSLKRHLNTEHKMSPADYRAAFNLKADYLIVAPNYAAQRSALAKSLGLGRMAGKKRGAAVKKTGARTTARKTSA